MNYTSRIIDIPPLTIEDRLTSVEKYLEITEHSLNSTKLQLEVAQQQIQVLYKIAGRNFIPDMGDD